MALPKLSSTTSLSLIAVVVLAFGMVIAVVGSQQQQKTQSHASGPAVGDFIASGTVAATGATITVPGTFVVGVTYNVKVSGYVNYDKDISGGLLVDAQWGGTTTSPQCWCNNYSEPKFNGTGFRAADKGTAVNPNHVYNYHWKADTTSLKFNIVDSNYADNTGSLSYYITVYSLPTDTTAPTVPTNLSATAVSVSQINLSWTASTDAVGVTGYKVFRNGTQIATVSTTAYQDTGLTASTTYIYTVSAYDAAGNNSAQSNQVSAKTLGAADPTAPSTPGNLVPTVVSASQINLSWNASTDNVGVTCYKVWRDGTLLTTLGNVTSYQDTGLTADTLYSYEVAACDAAGNVSGKAGPVQGRTLALTPPNTKLKFDILLHGIGNAGDSANPNGGGGNFNVVHLQRVLRVEVLDGNDAVIASNPNGLVLFDTQSGSFKGVIDMGTQIPSTGTYGVRVKMTQSLKKLKIQAITVGTTNEIPQMTLTNGDVNDDNAVSINVADYNILLGCYSDFTPAIDCDSTRKAKADLNDDGNVNFNDLNLFLRELNTSTGQ